MVELLSALHVHGLSQKTPSSHPYMPDLSRLSLAHASSLFLSFHTDDRWRQARRPASPLAQNLKPCSMTTRRVRTVV